MYYMYECVLIIISIYLNYKLICDLENQKKKKSTDGNDKVTLLYSIVVCSILLFLQMEPG